MIFTIVLIALVLMLSLVAWTYVLGFLETQLIARSQQRIGPNRLGPVGFFQGLMDTLKAFAKDGLERKSEWPVLETILFVAVVVLPYAFTLIVLFPAVAISPSFSNVLFLHLVLLLSLSLNNLFQFIVAERGEQLRIRQQTLLSLLGVTIFFIASLVPAIRSVDGSLSEVSALQSGFPFFMILRSPFIFVAALVAFFSMFFVLPIAPVVDTAAKTFSGVRTSLYRHSTKVWLLGLASLWVHIFLGGGASEGLGPLGIVTFVLKTTLVAALVLWSGRTVAIMRPNDAIHFALSRLMPLAILVLMAELALAILVHS